MKEIKLNIGCGSDIRKGYINVDKIKAEGINLVWDLNKYPYPFKNNSVDKIYASHILEHTKDFEKCFKEFSRILKVGGMFHIKVPHYSACSNNCEFHHVSFEYQSLGRITPVIFKYISLEYKEFYKEYFVEYKRLNFYKKPYFFWNYLIEPIINLSRYFILFWEHTALHNLFPARELEVILRKRKNV